jgi:hypothetical protein
LTSLPTCTQVFLSSPLYGLVVLKIYQWRWHNLQGYAVGVCVDGDCGGEISPP